MGTGGRIVSEIEPALSAEDWAEAFGANPNDPALIDVGLWMRKALPAPHEAP